MPAVPALHANSRSAACESESSESADTSMPLVGFTAYGCDSDPTKIAEIWDEGMPDVSSASCAASKANVKLSSSRPGTDFSSTPRLAKRPTGSCCQCRAISEIFIRYFGRYTPKPTIAEWAIEV